MHDHRPDLAPSPRRRARRGAGRGGGAVLLATGTVQAPDVQGALTSLAESLGPWTYALVAVLAFLETGAFVGLVAPGETAIVLGGVVAAQGEVSLPLIVLAAWLAAALGDLASYALGRRLGRRFLVTHGPRVGVTAPRLARVEGFFDRHGGKAILIGRFVGLVRAVAPFVAGASSLPLRRFLPFSLARHARLGDRLHARGLRVPRVLRDRGRRAHPRRARPGGARGGRGRVQDAPRPPLAVAQREASIQNWRNARE